MIPTLVGVAVLTFVVMRLVPGDIVALRYAGSSVPQGVIAAVRQDSWVDYAIRIFSVGGLAMPSFWIGIMLVLGTITFFGWAPPLVFTPITEDPIANLSQLILPAVSVGYRYSAVSMRMTRSTLLEVLREDYV